MARRGMRLALCGAMAGLAAISWSAPSSGRTFSSYAFVNDDATLEVSGRLVHLFGIYIPPTNRFCRSNMRPVKCASRAALALEFKIQGFVECEEKARNRDRSIVALCRAKGEDLSAYLIRRGWAVALPGAPFSYTVLERIAKQHNMGVWGFHADVVVDER